MADPTAAFEAYTFSPAEVYLYSRVFNDVELDGLAHGDTFAGLLRKSGLSDEILGRVWDISDRSMKGYLTRIECFVALRAVALAQHRQPMTKDAIAVHAGLSVSELPQFGPEFTLPTEEDVRSCNPKTDVLERKVNSQFVMRVAPPVKQEGKVADHMVYSIHIHCTMGLLNSIESVAYRRYSDFEWLRSRLLEVSMGHVVPPLPPKKYFGRFEKEFLDVRRHGLETFLNRLAADPLFVNAKPLITFLQADDEAFARAKSTTTPNLVDQVIQALQASMQNLSLRTSGVKHALPTDGKLEDFANRLSTIKSRLKECKRLHQVLLVELAQRSQSQAELLSILVPPTVPLSVQETENMKDDLMNQFDARRIAASTQFSEVLDSLVGQVRAVEEVMVQRKEAHKKFDLLQRKLEAKQQKQATIKGTTGAEKTAADLERDMQSLAKESDAARHKFDTISRALEAEILRFENLRVESTHGALKALVLIEKEAAEFQVKWWSGVLSRVASANASEFAATIDVPVRLIEAASMDHHWYPASEHKARTTPKALLFEPGQASARTIPLPVYPGEGPVLNRPPPVMVHSSIGEDYVTAHASTLPRYAHAIPSESGFLGSAPHLDDDDFDDFTVAKAHPVTSNVPEHWDKR
eukprot:c20997_g1_i1.p1 GENE.c20997_g1_i1~~c20997_g1_i1.p1  ORF type:complete len:638 (-),score=153.99 c20997_g1_i1:585-2498(-)